MAYHYGLDGQGYATFVTGLVFSVLAPFFIVIRFLTRRWNHSKIGADDLWLIPGLLGTWAYVGLFSWGMSSFHAFATPVKANIREALMGDHHGNINISGSASQIAFLRSYYKAQYFCTPVYAIAISCIKISVICLYRRLFTTPKFRMASLVVLILCVAWAVVGVIAGFLYCVPMAHFWNPAIEGYCYNYSHFFLPMEIFDTILDAAIIFMPIKVVWSLQMSLNRRILIIGVFLTSSFVFIVGIVKIVELYQPTSRHSMLAFAEIEDPVTADQRLVATTRAGLWNEIQLGTAIICACLPLYKPLLIKVAGVPNSIRSGYASLWGTSRTALSHEPSSLRPKLSSVDLDSRCNRMDKFSNDDYRLTNFPSINKTEVYTVDRDDMIPLHGIQVDREVDVV